MSKTLAWAGACAISLLALPACAQGMAASGAPQFVMKQTTNEWRASKLSGVDVYGPDNKKIGSIDDIMLDSSGQAKVVVIGVGGFLGIGQKDVGVPFSDLQWRNEAEGRTAASSSSSDTVNPEVAAAARGYPDHAVLNASKDQLQNAPDFTFVSNTSNNAPATSAPTATSH